MDVYLIRHAEAVEQNGQPDEERPLTDTGRAQAEHLAQALPARGAKIERLYVSPLVRTQQTAEPLATAWGLATEAVIECRPLAPGGKKRKLARMINDAPEAVIGLVGHRPDLNELAGWLIGTKRTQIALDKAGVALIRVDGEFEKGSGELIWLLPAGWA